jgi:phosphatidylserine decarboxylase
MVRLAKGTALWVAVPAILGLAFLTLTFTIPALSPPGGLFTEGALLALAGFFAYFFRDPERHVAGGIVSPADGVVTSIDEAEDGGHVVVIFMNLHNVHVNRAPCDGTVRRREHRLGSHLPAWAKESDRNERITWDLDTPHGDVRVVQIAGLLARRIVPYAKEGQRLRKGERLGIIRLGSRVDVHLPAGIQAAVGVGDRVLAGSTTLALPAK